MTVDEILKAFTQIEAHLALRHDRDARKIAAGFAFDLSRMVAQDAKRELVLRREGK